MRIDKNFFSGSAKVFSAGADGLAAVIQAISRSLAVLKIGSGTVLTDSTGGTPSATDELEDVTGTPTQTLINNNFATVAAKINILIAAVSSGLAALTDSSGGSADSGRAMEAINDILANTAASGSNLVQVASFNTEVTKVENAFTTLMARANSLATSLGLPTVTDSGGGTDGAGTIAAMAATVTGATTGVALEEYNVSLAELLAHEYTTVIMINRLAAACGQTQLEVPVNGVFTSPIPVYTDHATHSAVALAVTKVEADAHLVSFRNNVATMAEVLDDCVGASWSVGAVAA